MMPFGLIRGIQRIVVCCCYPVELCTRIHTVTAQKSYVWSSQLCQYLFVWGNIFTHYDSIKVDIAHCLSTTFRFVVLFSSSPESNVTKPIIMGSLCRENVYCHTGFLLLVVPDDGAESIPKRHLYQVCPQETKIST
jgi:hypothetical protein